MAAANRARLAWTLPQLPRFLAELMPCVRAADEATAPASAAEQVSPFPRAPSAFECASKHVRASRAILLRCIRASSSGHHLHDAPFPAPHNNAHDLPNKIRPLKKCDGYRSLADTIPKAPASGRRVRFRRQTGESFQTDDARWPSSGSEKSLPPVYSTTPANPTSSAAPAPTAAPHNFPPARGSSDIGRLFPGPSLRPP